MTYWFKFWEKVLILELLVSYLPKPIWKKSLLLILYLQLYILEKDK